MKLKKCYTLFSIFVLFFFLLNSCKVRQKNALSNIFYGYEILDLPTDTVFIGGLFEFNSKRPIADTGSFKTYVYKSFNDIELDMNNKENVNLYINLSKKLKIYNELNKKLKYKIKIKKASVHSIYNISDLKLSVGQKRLIEAIKLESIEITTELDNNIVIRDSLIKYKEIDNINFRLDFENKNTIVCKGLNLFVAIKSIRIDELKITSYTSTFDKIYSSNYYLSNQNNAKVDYFFDNNNKLYNTDGIGINPSKMNFNKISCIDNKTNQTVFELNYYTRNQFEIIKKQYKAGNTKLTFLNSELDTSFGYIELINKKNIDYEKEKYVWCLNSYLINSPKKEYINIPIIIPMFRRFDLKKYYNELIEIQIKKICLDNNEDYLIPDIGDIEVKYIKNEIKYEL